MPALYLSRLLLDTRKATIAATLADCQRLHAWLLTAFPDAPGATTARKAHGILYRAEELRTPHYGVRMLVQSHTQPDWSKIPARGLLRALDERGNPAVRDIDGLYARVEAGQRLRFRLRASPTLATFHPGERGRRVPLRGEVEQIDWLGRQGERLGFHVATVVVAGTSTVYGVKRAREGDETLAITHQAALFEGILEVADSARFQKALREGVGRGKAYGLGLLSVAELSENR